MQTLGDSFVGGEQDYKSKRVGTGFSGQLHQSDCAEKLCAQDFCQSFQTRVHGTCMVDGGEAVGNSLHGRAVLRGSETEATTGWTAGKLWEMERRGASLDPRERDGSAGRAWAGRVARVFRGNFNQCDVLKIVCPRRGNSWGRAA